MAHDGSSFGIDTHMGAATKSILASSGVAMEWELSHQQHSPDLTSQLLVHARHPKQGTQTPGPAPLAYFSRLIHPQLTRCNYTVALPGVVSVQPKVLKWQVPPIPEA